MKQAERGWDLKTYRKNSINARPFSYARKEECWGSWIKFSDENVKPGCVGWLSSYSGQTIEHNEPEGIGGTSEICFILTKEDEANLCKLEHRKSKADNEFLIILEVKVTKNRTNEITTEKIGFKTFTDISGRRALGMFKLNQDGDDVAVDSERKNQAISISIVNLPFNNSEKYDNQRDYYGKDMDAFIKRAGSEMEKRWPKEILHCLGIGVKRQVKSKTAQVKELSIDELKAEQSKLMAQLKAEMERNERLEQAKKAEIEQQNAKLKAALNEIKARNKQLETE